MEEALDKLIISIPEKLQIVERYREKGGYKEYNDEEFRNKCVYIESISVTFLRCKFINCRVCIEATQYNPQVTLQECELIEAPKNILKVKGGSIRLINSNFLAPTTSFSIVLNECKSAYISGNMFNNTYITCNECENINFINNEFRRNLSNFFMCNCADCTNLTFDTCSWVDTDNSLQVLCSNLFFSSCEGNGLFDIRYSDRFNMLGNQLEKVSVSLCKNFLLSHYYGESLSLHSSIGKLYNVEATNTCITGRELSKIDIRSSDTLVTYYIGEDKGKVILFPCLDKVDEEPHGEVCEVCGKFIQEVTRVKEPEVCAHCNNKPTKIAIPCGCYVCYECIVRGACPRCGMLIKALV